MMQRELRILLPAALLAGSGFFANILAQETRTVWTGVYTADQASRGAGAYDAACGRCHAPDLSGRVGGSLKGDVFNRDWTGEPVSALYDRIRNTMPRGAPASLSDQEYLDIVTYILQANDFPASPTAELKPADLKNIRIESKDGPAVVPNFSLVESVGCLTQAPEKAWTLTKASDVARTRDPGVVKDEALKAATEKALGGSTLKLLYIFPDPIAYKDHKVNAKGFLIRDPKGDSVNVTSLQTLGSSCN